MVHLEAAKTAKVPEVSLKAARRAVANAQKNKRGERKEALAAIEQAIKATDAGNNLLKIAKIENAVADVKQGMNNPK